MSQMTTDMFCLS